MKKQKKSRVSLFIDNHPVIFLITVLILPFALVFLLRNPKLQFVRDSFAYIIIWKVLISGLVLYFTWFTKKKPIILEKILLTLFAVSPWASLFIHSYKITSLVLYSILILLSSCIAVHFCTDKKYTSITQVVTAYLFLMMCVSVRDYTFVDDIGFLVFVPLASVLSAIVTTVFIILLKKNKIRLKKDNHTERVTCSVLLFLGLLIGISFMACHLNYIFDTSEPAVYSAVISEKHVDTGRRKVTKYVLVAKVKNKTQRFSVSQSEYYRKNVGGVLKVECYSGAFGVEYYISE